MKRLLSLFIALSMIMTILPMNMTVFASSTDLQGTCGDNLTWVLQDNGVLVISGEGPMADYRNSSAPWVEVSYLAEIPIEQVVFEEGVTEISNYAFAWMGELKHVSFSSTVSKIYDSTFVSCMSLQTFEVTEDNAYFSSDDTGVLYDKNKTMVMQYPSGNPESSYTLPASVTQFNTRAFTGAKNLEQIEVENGSTAFSSLNGVLFSADETKLVIYPGGNPSNSYTIPDGVTTVCEFAFEEANSLTNVDFPTTLTTIEHMAFGDCFALTEVVLPDSVTVVESQAFAGCMNLRDVTLSANLTEIDSEMFTCCETLEEIEIPDGVTAIWHYAFDRCTNLSRVVIPVSVDTIYDEAFGECDNLTIFGYAGSYAQTYAEDNNIPFQVIGQGGVDGGGSGNQGNTSPAQGYYTLTTEYNEGLCSVNLIDPSTSVVIDDGKIAYDENGEAVINISTTSLNGANVKGLYINGVKWIGTMTSGNVNTWFEGVRITEDSTIRIEAERKLSVDISFPETTYINGTLTCAVDVWGVNTNKNTSLRFNITSADDKRIDIDLSENSDTSYYVSFYVMNYENADSNISVYTTYYYRYTGYDNLTKTYGSKQSVYLQNNRDNIISVVLPEGRLIKGKLIIPDDAFIEENAEISEVQAWFTDEEGNYADFAWGVVDEDLNYSIPIPEDLSGKYTISIRPEFCRRNSGEEGDNTSSSDNDEYYPHTNLVIKSYDYMDENGEYKYFTIPETGTVNNVDIAFETGYIVSGVVEIPDDAVLGNGDVWMSVAGNDADNSEFVDGEGDYYFELNYEPGKTAYEYYFAVSKKIEKLILSAMVRAYEDGESGVIPNLVNGNVYYVSNGVMTASQESATRLEITEDKSDIKLVLLTGSPISMTFTKPNGEREYIYFDVDLYSKEGTAIINSSYSMSYYSTTFTESLVVPKGHDEVYVSYDIDEYTSDTTLYNGKVFVNPDGSYSKTIDGAEPWSMSAEEIEIVFATVDAVNSIPEADETAEFNFKVHDNSAASAMPVPIEGATVRITDGEGFSFMGESNSDGNVTVELILGKSYTVETFKTGYSAHISGFEATAQNAEKTTYIPLIAISGGGDTSDENKNVSFTVFDKDTDYPVSGATLTITEIPTSSGETGTATPEVYAETMDVTDITSDGEVVITTSIDGTAETTLADGTYNVVVTKDGYVTKTETIEVSDDEYEFEIAIEQIEVVIMDNTTFYVKDGDSETTPAISGASLTIEDLEGNIITRSTDANGFADANLDDGTYYVSVIADGYKTRSFMIERSETKNSFTVYLSKDDIIDVKSTVKEMTPEEMEDAGIDTDAIGNKQVYNCTAVLSFMPDVSISYYYDSKGDIVKGDKPITVYVDNTAITPVGRDIYLIVKSTTTWLKETFEVQIICDNTSAVETVENLTANLTIPEGLSLAIMTEGMVNEATAVLGDVLPKGTTSHKWYITGDEEGEYSLDGTLTGTRTGGGISEDINLTFGIEDSIKVLAGSALELTIDAETIGIVGEPYYMRYTLENASDKTLYDLSFSVFGGKFFEDFGVKEVKYAKEYGPDAIKDLDGKGFVFETDEFKPEDKVQGVFEIEFGEELLLGEGQEWILKKAFVITGAGSTTEIPVIINWEYDVPAHDWNEGIVTKAATCTEDGIMTYTCKDEDCEETYTEKISATGHNMGEYITVQPTCTSEGSMTSRCQNDGCDHTVVLPLAKADHAWKTDYTIDKKPTCTEKGSKSIHCENCSAVTDVQDVKETGHSFSEWKIRTAATCEGTGEDYRVCANGCNTEETRTVGSLGHSFATEWTVDVAAKCEEKGSESRHCSRCSATTDNRDIPETGHSFTEWKTRTEAKCETEGEEYHVCQNGCGKEETRAVPVLGHDWDDGTITKNPTETETGNKVYSCKRCPETKNEILPMLIKQDVGFTVPEMTYNYGDKEAIYNEAYNDSEDGSELTYSSSNENVATVDKGGKITIIGAGETTITAKAAATDKYLETTATFKLIIKKAALTITANDTEIYYGEEGKNNGFTATGFVLGETEAVIKGTPVYEVNYKQFNKAGEYEITVDKLTADNYEITLKPGKLTVKKAEVYNIEFSELSQRKGKIAEVKTSVTPKDDTAKIKVEYQFADDVWVDTIPSDIGIGEYKVRAYLTESENLTINETPKYFESTLEIKAGAVVNLDGNSDLSIDSNVSGDNVEFTIPDAAVEEIINNVPESGEIVIDASGSTEGVTNLTLPENIITALDESENVNTFTVVADDAEISMSAEVLKTVAKEMSAGDKVNVHIEAVEKDSLNEEQKAALDAIATDAHVLQLKLEVQKQDGTTELHELNGKVEVKAAYTLPSDMNGKKIVVCYVSDNGTVTYMRATYKDGFVHFKTDHFSHYAIAAIECTHTWDTGTVITQATTSSEGLKRYECTICGETKDETIPKKSGYVGGGGGGTASYTVKFETNGAGTIKSQTINKNAVATEPIAPTKEGYTFAGWYTDKELTIAYDFASKVTKSFTLFAKWTEIEKEPEEDKQKVSMTFTDVKSTDWFFDSVKYVAENNLMNGVSETEFAPNSTLTRAMLVTILYRHAGEPATNRSIPFADVDMGAYYANAVSWAKQNGIVSGVTENEFAPDANITREQIATILFRYAQLNGMETMTLEENLHFADSTDISEFAISAMNWAVGKDLIKGKTTSTLNPKDNATRAEIAAILQRFIQNNK